MNDTKKIVCGETSVIRCDDLGRIQLPRELFKEWGGYNQLPCKMTRGENAYGHPVVVVEPYSDETLYQGFANSIVRPLVSIIRNMGLPVSIYLTDAYSFNLSTSAQRFPYELKGEETVKRLYEDFRKGYTKPGSCPLPDSELRYYPIIHGSSNGLSGVLFLRGAKEDIDQCHFLAEYAALMLGYRDKPSLP